MIIKLLSKVFVSSIIFLLVSVTASCSSAEITNNIQFKNDNHRSSLVNSIPTVGKIYMKIPYNFF